MTDDKFKERARKICEPRETNGLNLDQRQRELLIPLIAAQLREVEREAFEEGFMSQKGSTITFGPSKIDALVEPMKRISFAEGFNAAKEKAAEWLKTKSDREWEEYLELNAGRRTLMSFEQFCAERIGDMEP